MTTLLILAMWADHQPSGICTSHLTRNNRS